MSSLAPDTFKSLIQVTVNGLSYWGGYWGQRLLGGTLALVADMLSLGTTQAFYARLPGHPQQAPDSLTAAGNDRVLIQFRGETQPNYAARVRAAWDDYAQGGTAIQMLHVLNQWGEAGWPDTWDPSLLTLVESGSPTDFSFTVTIQYGSIIPAWSPVAYGAPGLFYGQPDLFYGPGPSNDIPMLLYLVRKWKPSRSKGFVTVFFLPGQSITFTV